MWGFPRVLLRAEDAPREVEAALGWRVARNQASGGLESGETVQCRPGDLGVPSKSSAHDVTVRSWVRADRADLDEPLASAVASRLTESWPWQHPDLGR